MVGELWELAVALAPGGAGPEDALQPPGLAGTKLQFGAHPLGVRPALT